MEQILEEVAARVTPTREEEERLLGLAQKIMERIEKVSAAQGVQVQPLLVGSLAKGTWLRGEGDLDIFMLFPKGHTKKELEEKGLAIAEQVAEGRGIRAYAEHPYLRFYVDGVKVDLVPALKVDRADAKATAVDRTPFHLEYVRSRLDDELRKQVRILKRFMKGLGIYGAEAKTQGFSGYVCELLTIKWHTFLGVLEEASTWRPPTTVWLEAPPAKRFDHHIVVVDPTDPSRNAAAAVSEESYSTLIAASQAFLERPSTLFFYPPPPAPIVPEKTGYGQTAHLVLVELEAPSLVEEVVWSELRSTAHGMLRQLQKQGFGPYRHSYWFGGQHAYIWFETERVLLPAAQKRVGPPVYDKQNTKRFLEKNLGATLRGPWIEGQRWVVLAPTKTRSVEQALRRADQIDMGPHIRQKYGQAKIYVDGEALQKIVGEPGLHQEFSRFYGGTPHWLTQSS